MSPFSCIGMTLTSEYGSYYFRSFAKIFAASTSSSSVKRQQSQSSYVGCHWRYHATENKRMYVSLLSSSIVSTFVVVLIVIDAYDRNISW